jgi:hypothetical protein
VTFDQQPAFFIDLGDGAEGQTLLIVVHDITGIQFLFETITALAERRRSTAVVEQGHGEPLGNCRSITFRAVKGKYPQTEVKTDNAGMDVIWSQSPEDWDNAAGLREGIMQGPGHQYFDDYTCSLGIEVSYGEYTRDSLYRLAERRNAT